jgi:nucleotide-binding universal stress UspA family protein
METTIVCAIDPHDEGFQRLLRIAADLAQRLGRPLVLAHVAPSDPISGGLPATTDPVPPAPALPYPYPVALEGPELDRLRDDARGRVERLAEQCGVQAAKVSVAFDVSVAEGLRRIAAEHHGELLVVGSRGRGTVRAALLGSTSHALAAHAPCPVVVVPPSG